MEFELQLKAKQKCIIQLKRRGKKTCTRGSYAENVKNPNFGVVPMCKNMKVEWLPSMALSSLPKTLKDKTKTKMRVLPPKTLNPNVVTSPHMFRITKLQLRAVKSQTCKVGLEIIYRGG